MPVTAPPPEVTHSPAVVEIDNGVIEEARRRQRRRQATGTGLGAGAVVVAIAALLIGGGGKGNTDAAGEPSSAQPRKLTLVHGRAFLGGQPALMGVTLSLQAGNVGVCVKVLSTGSCNGPLPSVSYPVYGGEQTLNSEKVGPEGRIDAIFTAPGVAAMRVAHMGTFKAESAPGLPPGAKQIAFYRPPGSRGTVLPPGSSPQVLQRVEHAEQGPALTETLLDASGRAIPIGHVPPTFTLPYSYWQGAQAPPARGRCAMSSSLPGVRAAWGQVATKIAPDRDIAEPGWFTCLHTWFSLDGASYETAVLLNAKSPGQQPTMLWGAIPVPRHPGTVQIPPVQREFHFSFPKLSSAQAARDLAQVTKTEGRARAEQFLRQRERLSEKEQTYWDVLVPPTVARRVGPAWVLVRGGNSLVQRMAFLQALHVTRLKLPHGRADA